MNSREAFAKGVALPEAHIRSESTRRKLASGGDGICNLPSSHEISKALSENGYIKVEGCFSRQFVEAIKSDIDAHRFHLNRNGLSGVYSNTQYYFVNLLAASRTFVKFITSAELKEVLTSYFDKGCRLKAMRYYETYGGHHMQWHTYCEDVADGEFQYIRGSHKWSGDRSFNDYTDDYIAKHHANEITGFAGPAGTLVIYNTYGIHRAKPVKRRDYVRKSVFFQIDAETRDGEAIILDPSLFEPSVFADKWMFQFLGFGEPSTYGVWPKTDIADVPMRSLAPQIFGFIRHRPKRMIRSLLPRKWKERIRAKVGG
jgi:hypothetical protein